MRKLVCDFAEFEFHEFHAVVRVNEGLHLCSVHVPEFVNIINKHMPQEFGLVCEKVNRYSIDPFIVPKLFRGVLQFRSWCTVHQDARHVDEIYFSKVIFPPNFPVGRFVDLEDAVNWSRGHAVSARSSTIESSDGQFVHSSYQAY